MPAVQLPVAALLLSSVALIFIALTVLKSPLAIRNTFNLTWQADRHITEPQLTSTSHYVGAWRTSPDRTRCSRPLNPAFFPYSEKDRKWTAPVVSFYAAAASGNTAAAEEALGCIDAIGFQQQLINRNKKLHIALLGDSTDRFTVDGFCELFGGQPHTYTFNAHECNSSLLHIRSHWITGSDLDGLKQADVPDLGPVLPGIAKFFARSPLEWDIVIMNSLHWDLHKLHAHQDPAALSQSALPEEFLSGWMRNVTEMMQQVKALAPRAKLMWRTSAAVQGACEGNLEIHAYNSWTTQPYINYHIAAMNDAGRAAAAANGFVVQDLGMLTRSLHYGVRLMDTHHPQPHILMELLNRVLIAYFIS